MFDSHRFSVFKIIQVGGWIFFRNIDQKSNISLCSSYGEKIHCSRSATLLSSSPLICYSPVSNRCGLAARHERPCLVNTLSPHWLQRPSNHIFPSKRHRRLPRNEMERRHSREIPRHPHHPIRQLDQPGRPLSSFRKRRIPSRLHGRDLGRSKQSPRPKKKNGERENKYIIALKNVCVYTSI